jgi:hypothetical protein
MPVVENGFLGLACTALDADNAAAVKNRIAFVLRGACTFVTKAANVQAAGAVGMIVVDNVAGSPPTDLGGTDPTITIPAVRITLKDGITLLSGMKLTPGNRSSGVVAMLGVDPTQLAGADRAGRVMLYTPSPFQPGSSVSHWDTSAFHNLLMEPAINADLTQSVDGRGTGRDVGMKAYKDQETGKLRKATQEELQIEAQAAPPSNQAAGARVTTAANGRKPSGPR